MVVWKGIFKITGQIVLGFKIKLDLNTALLFVGLLVKNNQNESGLLLKFAYCLAILRDQPVSIFLPFEILIESQTTL